MGNGENTDDDLDRNRPSLKETMTMASRPPSPTLVRCIHTKLFENGDRSIDPSE